MNNDSGDVIQNQALLLLREALEFDTDAERQHLLDERCTDRPDLRERVRAMLARAGNCDESAEPVDDTGDALLGSQLGAFRVVERIGRGGMGVVYRGVREGSDFVQEVAIKLIRRGFDFDDVQARFRRERRILARLSHPNLAHFIDGGVSNDGRPWFALEYVRGTTITRWADACTLGIRARIELFLDACSAVQHAHTRLIVHRDLKPGNILVEQSGAVRLLDFGVAGLLAGESGSAELPSTLGSRPAMTPEYAAPEQFNGEGGGVSVDVYALGVTLFELVSGVLPYAIDRGEGSRIEQVVRDTPPQPLAHAITRGDPAATADSSGGTLLASRLANRSASLRSYRALVRGDLSRIVEKALAKDPARRYPTVQALADDLGRWLAGSPVRVSGNRFGYRLGLFIRRNRVAVSVTALLVIGLIAATVLAIHSARAERLQREQAVLEAARSNAVRGYVTLMFRNATQGNPLGTLTAGDVLKRGADDIFTHFKDDPVTGQTTALMLSELYAALGDPEGALPLLARLLEWPGIDENPELLAAARFGMATVKHHLGKDEEARELLAAAQDFWLAQPGRYGEPLSSSRTLQARLERMSGRVDQAIATLDLALRERRALHAFPDKEVAYALVTQSITLAQAGRPNEAFDRAEASVAEYTALGLADSTEGLTALGNRAAITTMLGRNEEALPDLRKVSRTLSVYGPSEALAKADTQLGELLAKLGRFDEALPLLTQALAMAESLGGADGRLAAGSRQRLADAYMAAGRYDDAAPQVDYALAHAIQHYGADHRDTGIAYRLRAKLRIGQHRLAEANADLAIAEAIFIKLGKPGESQLRRVAALREEAGAASR